MDEWKEWFYQNKLYLLAYCAFHFIFIIQFIPNDSLLLIIVKFILFEFWVFDCFIILAVMRTKLENKIRGYE